MMENGPFNPYWEDGRQQQLHQERPPQRKISRRVLLIGGLGGLAAGSLLTTATIAGIKLLQSTPQSHPFLTIPSGGDSDDGKLFWSPDSKRIAICDTSVRLLDGQSGHQIWDYQPALPKGYHVDSPTALTWSPDGNRIYYVNNKTLHALDANSGQHLWMDALISNDDTPLAALLTWSPDGSRCAVGPITTPSVEGSVVFIWNIAERNLSATCSLPVTSFPEALSELAWSPDGNQLASIDQVGSILVWSASDGTPTWSWSYVDDHGAFSLVSPWINWSSKGDILASGYFLGEYTLWQASSGKQLFQKKPDAGRYASEPSSGGAVRSPDGTRLMLATFQDSGHLLLQVWNIQSNQLLFTCQNSPQGQVNDTAWSPDGKYLAASYSSSYNGEDSGIQIWDASNGNALAFYKTPLYPAGNLAWSPDSRSLAVYTATGEQCSHALLKPSCLLTKYAYQIFHI